MLEDDRAFLEDFAGVRPNPTKQYSNDVNLLETSTNSSDSHSHIIQTLVRSPSGEKRSKRSRKSSSGKEYQLSNIVYRGMNVYQAAEQGNMPVCVLLWSMASSKRVNLIVADNNGNNPMHYAAVADTPEVVQFLLQQTRNNDEFRLVDSRNFAGETPLLRCMTTGNIPIAKVLIDEGSDPLATDNSGASIFTRLARAGRLWCLNFMFNSICNLHGPQVTMELMSSMDAEGKNPLDWAAEAGNLNVIEFFIRRGLNPHRLDLLGRTCLSWAVRSNKVEAAQFLVMCGCDPNLKDAQNTSPMQMAIAMKDKELIQALKAKSHVPKSIPELEYGTIQNTDPTNNSNILYKREGNKMKSIVIFRRNGQRIRYLLAHSIFFLVLWLFAVFFPFYAVIPAYIIIYFVYRWTERFYRSHPGIKSPLQRFVHSQERGLGLWVSSMIVYAVYLVTSYFHTEHHKNAFPMDYTDPLKGFQHVDPKNLFHIEGISGGMHGSWFLYSSFLCFFVSIFTWWKLVWWDWNPGIIDNRVQDFEEILAHSFISAGEPARGLYCRTTMVKKPIRSKYCVLTGAVVARMDHYCTWLNTTIGYKNHRSFMAFLFAHFCMVGSASTLIVRALYRDMTQSSITWSACDIVSKLVGRWYFFVIVLGCMSCVATVLLAMLLYDQGLNIVTNWTTNERINLTRYPWIMQQSDGSYTTRFDRGLLTNLLEFLCIPGYAIDYSSLFILPAELTQENMQLNNNSYLRSGSNHWNSIRLNNIHTAYTGPLNSGPPSIDLEMANVVNKPRADSIDSSDTSNPGTDM